MNRDAKKAECCGCLQDEMCVPVPLGQGPDGAGRWFWFCADCARAIAGTWAAACRLDGQLSVQTLTEANAAVSS
jgi:hypothetical protein